MEILAPAGSPEAMRAAVRAGADAVYFGYVGFNARARAQNQDAESLADAMAFLHTHGVRGYVTLNTLVFDSELPALEAAIHECAKAGVDAVIVQDLGVARLVRAIAPTLALHASTQMTCTDAGSVQLATELGATRVILARELSISDLEAIRAGAPDAELEVFVHGALCIAYSGQCLTSEAIGGRSANRGACAQACRLPYDLVVDGELRDLGPHAHLLSPEDLEASAIVPELARLGIASLKIEGRLKGPDYVSAAVRLYREARDGAVNDETRLDALQAFSRGSGPGFFPGVDHQRLVDGRSCDHRGLELGTLKSIRRERGRTWLVLADTEHPIRRGDGLLVEGHRASEGELGGRVWEIETSAQELRLWLGPDVAIEAAADALIGHRVFKTSDPVRERDTLARIERDPSRVPIDVSIRGEIGEAPRLRATSARGHVAEVEADTILERAQKTPLDEARVREAMTRLGDTPFVLRGLEVALPADAILPVSSLNRARRVLTDALTRSLDRGHATTDVTATSLPRPRLAPPPPRGLTVLCRNLEQALAAIEAGADTIGLDFLELTGTGEAVRAIRAIHPDTTIALAPPRIRKPGEEKIDRFLDTLAPSVLYVRGLGALRDAASSTDGFLRVGDFSLNVTNHVTAREVLGRGVVAFTPSFDLDATQLLALLDDELAPRAEVVLHHPMPLFHMEHCVIAALLSEGKDYRSCGRPCEKHRVSLRDRAGIEHPVEADVGCRNTVFHGRAQSAADLVPRLIERGVTRFRIELVRERPEDVTRLVRAYHALIRGEQDARATLSELRTEGGYGVVKGSLRVLA